MARNDNRFTRETGENGGPAYLQDEDVLTSLAEDDTPEEYLDEPAQEEAFLRAPRRVAVRKGPVNKKTANRLKWSIAGIVAAGVLAVSAFALNRYAETSWRFRVESSDHIETEGVKSVPRAQIMEVMGSDIGRNLFKVPLAERKRQLEEIPWVESAAVMRFMPNRIRVRITERTPVAFVRIGSRVSLIDGEGVVMELPLAPANEYSFPVITGMSEGDPLSTRAARMKIYQRLVKELDGNGANYSKDLSEVELDDPEDIKITVEDPNGALVVHLGSSNFLERYLVYIKHISEWRQRFTRLESVDLRYNGQIIVNPDARAVAPPGPEAADAAPAQQ